MPDSCCLASLATVIDRNLKTLPTGSSTCSGREPPPAILGFPGPGTRVGLPSYAPICALPPSSYNALRTAQRRSARFVCRAFSAWRYILGTSVGSILSAPSEGIPSVAVCVTIP